MEIWDDDRNHFLNIGYKPDKIDVAFGEYRYLAAGPDSSNPRIYSKTVRNLIIMIRKRESFKTIKICPSGWKRGGGDYKREAICSQDDAICIRVYYNTCI